MQRMCVLIMLAICSYTSTHQIHQYIRNKDITSLQQLTTKTPNTIKQQDSNGYLPLHLAVRKGYIKVAEALLKQGGSPDITAQVVPPEHVHTSKEKAEQITGEASFDRIKRTPLQLAVSNNDYDMVELLLQYDANPNMVPQKTHTPLAMAVIHENKKIVNLLLEYGADINNASAGKEPPLHAAIGPNQNDFEMVQKLLQSGADPNLSGVAYRTPLHEAVSVNEHIVELLLESNARPNAQDKNGFTPLHTAAAAQDTPVVKKSTQILIENGAQAEAQTNDEETPLFIAARSGNISVLKLLLKKDARVNIKNKNGDTPLHVAARHAQPQAVTVLLRAKARSDELNNNDETPLNVSRGARSRAKKRTPVDTEQIKNYDKIIRKLKKRSKISRFKTSRRLSE